LDATFAYDWSPASVNRNNRELNAGLRLNERIPLHIHNTVSLGFVQNNLSSLFLQPEAPSWKAERAVESNVLLDVAPMLLLQPVVQYYAKVGGGRSALWFSESEQRSSFRNSFQRFGGLL
jgi:porin